MSCCVCNGRERLYHVTLHRIISSSLSPCLFAWDLLQDSQNIIFYNCHNTAEREVTRYYLAPSWFISSVSLQCRDDILYYNGMLLKHVNYLLPNWPYIRGVLRWPMLLVKLASQQLQWRNACNKKHNYQDCFQTSNAFRIHSCDRPICAK